MKITSIETVEIMEYVDPDDMTKGVRPMEAIRVTVEDQSHSVDPYIFLVRTGYADMIHVGQDVQPFLKPGIGSIL